MRLRVPSRDAVAGRAPGVAVDQRRRPVAPQACQEPAHLAHREVQDQRRLLGAQVSVADVAEHEQAVLCAGVHADRLPRLHGERG